MSQDGVHNTEMDLPEEPEAHLPSELVGDMRLAYGARLPRAGAALRSLLENGLPRPESENQRSFRGSLVRLAAVSMALFGTMSGLAVAGALPAPVQNAMSGVAQTVGVDIPDSRPADSVAVGTSFEEGTNGANGAGGGSTPKTDGDAPASSPDSTVADQSNSSTVIPLPGWPTAAATTPSTDRTPRSTPASTPRDTTPDDGEKDDPTPTTAEPDPTPTTAEPEVTSTTTTTVPEEPPTTTTTLPEGTGSPMGGE